MLQTPGASTAAKVALTDLINSLDDLPSSQAASTRPYVLVLEDYHIIDAQPVHEAFSFTIKIHGHLDDIWTEWFEGLTISRDTDGTTTLYGPVRDQAALYGLLIKVRDLSLTLISVNAVVDLYF